MQKITVTIGPDGNISYEVKGVKGKACKVLTKPIDDMGTVTETKNTSEFHQIASSTDTQLKAGG